VINAAKNGRLAVLDSPWKTRRALRAPGKRRGNYFADGDRACEYYTRRAEYAYRGEFLTRSPRSGSSISRALDITALSSTERHLPFGS